MKRGGSITEFSIEHPERVTGLMAAVTLLLALAAVLPSLLPGTFGFLPSVKVDTDPENMLPEHEAVRVFHTQMKGEFSLHDMIVLGVVNEKHPDGVFNRDSLKRIFELTEYAKTLRWQEGGEFGEQAGVIQADVIAPSTVDNIEQGGPGEVKFEWLMPSPPATREEALAIRSKAERIPFLNGTLLSEDGKALCLYLPLTSKDMSYKVYAELLQKIATFQGDEQYYITGLPVAEDTFGVEMFKQMAVSAPIAMLIIFLLMLFFFRKVVLVAAPMIVAFVSVVCTMGLLIATGNTVHIMSSMIPIFIVPIAVLDAVHILSEFFDRYQETRDRRATIQTVMGTLFTPMLYTSLTTAVGFASLALTPIPPVQIFGIFVSLGVIAAWIWTVAFIPAYVMFVPKKSLENFGAVQKEGDAGHASLLSRALFWLGPATYRYAKPILAVVAVLTLTAIYGISQIVINDNPVKWFSSSHPIRVADRVLNEHFGGTYMAYLALESQEGEEITQDFLRLFTERMDRAVQELKEVDGAAEEVFSVLKKEALRLGGEKSAVEAFFKSLNSFIQARKEHAPEEQAYTWDEALFFVDEERQRGQVFKQPEVLKYISQLQNHLLDTGIVGKSNSLSDIVKTTYRELVSGKDEDLKIPGSAKAVAQCLLTFQNSHRPQDLWHFVTPDFKKTSIWVQLKSGDNRHMSEVAARVDDAMKKNPPPFPLRHRWFGLTFINVVWQRKMVSGMREAFLGSFLIVFLMMALLFRSALWGILSMIPLTVTIALIYGAIGLMGKDYDMPVAVLSSLSLGLAVDYAIHFLSRSRTLFEARGSWAEVLKSLFGEPARAIARNVIVVGVGFLPLLLAPLVPYQTVGIFIAAILITAGLASLLILSALITLLERLAFPQTQLCCLICNCTTCIASVAAGVATVAISVHQFISVGWTALTGLSIVTILGLAGICFLFSRREKCRTERVGPIEKGGIK